MSFYSKISDVIYRCVSEERYLRLKFYRLHGYKLDFDNPVTFSEKLYWLKTHFYNREPMLEVIRKVYDKYNARDYIKEKVGEKYLPSLYGVYDSAEDIDFAIFPRKFVIKVTQSSGFNIIVFNKDNEDYNNMRKTLKRWQTEVNDLEKCKKKYKEEAYGFTGDSKILCEELLENSNGDIASDVRFYCFNGKPLFYCYDFNTVDEKGNKLHDYYRNAYTLDGEIIPVDIGRPRNESLVAPKFDNFEEMIVVSKKLSEDFPFVRVDLYNIDGRIVCGELTWIPMGGNGKIDPIEYEYLFGDMLKLPKK